MRRAYCHPKIEKIDKRTVSGMYNVSDASVFYCFLKCWGTHSYPDHVVIAFVLSISMFDFQFVCVLFRNWVVQILKYVNLIGVLLGHLRVSFCC